MKQAAAITFLAIGIACCGIGKLIVACKNFVRYVQDSSARPSVLFGLGYDQLLGIAGIVCLLVSLWLLMAIQYEKKNRTKK